MDGHMNGKIINACHEGDQGGKFYTSMKGSVLSSVRSDDSCSPRLRHIRVEIKQNINSVYKIRI
jgi:hypothetical protein